MFMAEHTTSTVILLIPPFVSHCERQRGWGRREREGGEREERRASDRDVIDAKEKIYLTLICFHQQSEEKELDIFSD